MRPGPESKIAAIVLAAGGASRFERPKQLLKVEGRSLIRRTVDAAVEAGCRPVVVVVGSEAERVRGELVAQPVELTLNPQWSAGLSSSVRAGIAALEDRWPAVRAALFLTCDQPRVTSRVLRKVCDAFDGAPGRMVACRYADTLGVPALFERARFEELQQLRGDVGAKALLRRHPDDVRPVSWPDGALDIDRPEDFERLGPSTGEEPAS